MTNDPTLSDADVYKAWHDSLRDPASNQAGQSVNGHSTGYEIAIDMAVANLFWNAARQMKAFGGTPFTSKQVTVDHTGSGTTPGDALGQATRDVSNGAWSSSGQHLHERLMVQLQKDADDIRKTCAIVRDPKEPRGVEYKSGDDLMAVTRSLCLGQ